MTPQCTKIFIRDESDEIGCRMMVMKENYNKKISPFEFDYKSRTVIPVNVNISMAVMDIVSISEIDLEYVLKFRFLMIWYDYRCGIYIDVRLFILSSNS